MKIHEFAQIMAEKAENMIARRYGITTVTRGRQRSDAAASYCEPGF